MHTGVIAESFLINQKACLYNVIMVVYNIIMVYIMMVQIFRLFIVCLSSINDALCILQQFLLVPTPVSVM